MKLSFDRVSRPASLVGVVILCGLTAVGCSKKEESTADKAEEAKVEVAPASVVACNDQVALAQLTNMVQSTLTGQSQKLFSAYAESAGESLSLNNVNTAVGSVLVDIANPTILQEANAQGMVTCNASLSLTLPNQDVARATRVYASLEDRNLADLLQSENITLNNNMLVSNNFNYVVGMQGGQVTARLVGQPAILTAASDIIAKSQFQAVLEANRAAPQTNKPRPAPALPAEPKQPAQPRVRPEPEQKQKAPARETQPARSAEPKAATKPTEPSVSTDNTKPSVEKPAATTAPAQSAEKPKLVVPKDDNIEMVIIEEDGTY